MRQPPYLTVMEQTLGYKKQLRQPKFENGAISVVLWNIAIM